MKRSRLNKKVSGRISNPLASGFVVIAFLAQFFVPLVVSAHSSVRVQPVSNPSLGESCGLNIALVMDSSGSISDGELATMKSAFQDFVGAFLPATPAQFSVTDFDSTAAIKQGFTTDQALINAAINAPTSGGNTNWQDGLFKAQSTFEATANPNLVIFASDGNPNRIGNNQSVSEGDAVSAAVTVANSLKNSGTRILALGIGNDLNLDNLKEISGPNVNTGVTSDVITTDFGTMAADLSDLATQICGGTITVKKTIDQDGNLQTGGDQTPGVGWNFNVAGSNQTTDSNGYTQSVNVKTKQGPFSVIETVNPDFTFLTANCSGSSLSNGSLSGTTVSSIGIGNGDIVSCVFFNAPNTVTPPVTFALDTVISGTGTGSVSSSPGGISCASGPSGSCSANFDHGSIVDLTATPDSGSTFGGWSGDCNGTSTCQVTMDAIKNVTATFNIEQGGGGGNGTSTPSADLSLEKTADKSQPQPLDTVIYSVTVSNAGPDTATGVVVTDTLPSGLDFVSASSTQGTYDNATHLWTIGTLAVEDSALLQITTTVQSDASGQIDNSASVTAIEADPALSNNSAEADIMIGSASPSESPSPSINPVSTSGGGGGNGPLPTSDAYANYLAQQAAAQAASGNNGQVAGATTEEPTSTPTPTPQGEVKGESTFLPPTGFDLTEALILVVLLLTASLIFMFAQTQLNLKKRSPRRR